MASTSSTRPSRRAVTHKKVIADDSDEETSTHTVSQENGQEDPDDYTPAPSRSPRRRTQQTGDIPTTVRTTTRSRRVRTGEGIEPSQIFEADQSMPPEPVSPTKNASPRKRKSVAVPRRGRISGSVDAPPHLPTPSPSVTPEVSQFHGTPLADITETTVNERNTSAEAPNNFGPIKPMDVIMEKPMDIVIRSRAQAVPSVVESTGPRARTVIKYLILTNFKSYAGKQEVGPFHASFSSVVGPNGSGKSNVIDSLLFVFGFRASKMRQGKISALIHNSAAFPNLDFCEVEVHFEEVLDLVRLRYRCQVQNANVELSRMGRKKSSRIHP